MLFQSRTGTFVQSRRISHAVPLTANQSRRISHAASAMPAGSADTSRPYSLHTFVASTFVRASADRWPRSRWLTLREFGHVELGWGKSFDHMRLSSPHHARLRPLTASLKKEAKTWSRRYSLGSLVTGTGFTPRKRR